VQNCRSYRNIYQSNQPPTTQHVSTISWAPPRTEQPQKDQSGVLEQSTALVCTAPGEPSDGATQMPLHATAGPTRLHFFQSRPSESSLYPAPPTQAAAPSRLMGVVYASPTRCYWPRNRPVEFAWRIETAGRRARVVEVEASPPSPQHQIARAHDTGHVTRLGYSLSPFSPAA
jgi:hypothetical protein